MFSLFILFLDVVRIEGLSTDTNKNPVALSAKSGTTAYRTLIFTGSLAEATGIIKVINGKKRLFYNF